MLPFLPLGDLDLGIVWCPKPKVWVDDNFVHLQTKRKEGDLSFQIHQKNYVSLHKALPCWCTADLSRRVDSGCTCQPSPGTSSCSWSPEQCSPCADPHHSVCPRCCKPDCLRWSSPAPRVLVWIKQGWHEAQCAALLTICGGERSKGKGRLPLTKSQS